MLFMTTMLPQDRDVSARLPPVPERLRDYPLMIEVGNFDELGQGMSQQGYRHSPNRNIEYGAVLQDFQYRGRSHLRKWCWPRVDATPLKTEVFTSGAVGRTQTSGNMRLLYNLVSAQAIADCRENILRNVGLMFPPTRDLLTRAALGLTPGAKRL